MTNDQTMNRDVKIIDAADQVAGRLASRIAFILQGKHKPAYQSHQDLGYFVQVINVDKLKFTGKKLAKKIYYRNTGYPGGIRTTKLSDLLAKRPDRLLRMMVSTMLPKNRLRQPRLKRLLFGK